MIESFASRRNFANFDKTAVDDDRRVSSRLTEITYIQFPIAPLSTNAQTNIRDTSLSNAELRQSAVIDNPDNSMINFIIENIRAWRYSIFGLAI